MAASLFTFLSLTRENAVSHPVYGQFYSHHDVLSLTHSELSTEEMTPRFLLAHPNYNHRTWLSYTFVS